ncbi:uncharacterized protein LOC111271642 [Varroa jacobsoni]|nr:uncharacterized protein LOC111271642 [Varroa jacobsoni]
MIPVEAGGVHQYRVTPVTVDGVLPARSSHWTYASPKPGEFEAPKNVRIIRMEGYNRRIKATIVFKHQILPSCDYSIDIINNLHGSTSRRIHSLPQDFFRKDLQDLAFTQNYTMVIKSTDSTGTIFSGFNYTRWFETPSCLEAFNHNFSMCAPGPPSMISVEETMHGLRLLWNPPPYTAPDNLVLTYEVQISTNPSAQQVPAVQAQALFMQRCVNASVNFIDVHGIGKSKLYLVQVRAKSRAGVGAPASVIYTSRGHSVERHLTNFIGLIVVASVMLILAVMTSKK